jgi:ATP-binding cassette subfamily C protein LapB
MDSMNEIMALSSEQPPEESKVSRPPLRGDIEFKNVSFSYPGSEQQALQTINFRIQAGEKVAVLGRNGSGKSTLEKLVMGLYPPEQGAVFLDGVDIRQFNLADVRRQIGYVPQDISLFSGSLRENITAGNASATDSQILEAARIAALDVIINNHPKGFELPVGEAGQQLSGGQRQAVAVARGVLGQPSILLMDEPTGSLDQNSESAIKSNLRQFAADKTLLLITHRSALLELVDRIIVIDAGQVVADGDKASVLTALNNGQIGSAR